jgi:phytoene dehydrogenase-like protein
MTRYDAVVIGSGPNGLAAANALGERGWSVLVLEGQGVAGGGLRTEELTLPGFRHDTFSAVHPAAAASPVFGRWELERFGLAWIHPEIAMAHPLQGGGCVSLHRDVGLTVNSLNQIHSGDGDRWAEFVDPYLAGFDAIRATVLGGFPPIRGAAKMVRQLGVESCLDFLRVTLSPASTIAEDLFRADAARAWLFGLGMHSDLGPQMSGTAVMAVHLALLGHAAGWPSPRGGAAALADSLIARLRSFGGELRLGAPADRLEIARGRVVGVEVGGELVRAKAVLCATSPAQMLRLGGAGLTDRYRVRLERFRQGPGVFKLDWALDGPIPWLADDAGKAGTVHLGADTAELAGASRALESGSLPRPPFLILGQQSLADPSRAPTGKHTAWGYTRIPAGCDEATLAAYVEAMESQVERFAPGFRQRILARHLLTPTLMEALNPNLRGGDIGGGSYALDQMILRPAPGISPYRTPIRGLFLASASAFPGGSVHGVCGWAAARCALRDAGAIAGLPTRLRSSIH